MQLNAVGKLAEKFCLQIPLQFEYAKLDAFVIMPNHVHVILIIDKMNIGRDTINSVCSDTINSVCSDTINRVSTGGITKNHNPMLHNNVSRIIRWYKGRTTFESRKINPEFGWQPRFYDHIVRNEKSLKAIRQYIINNPKMWHRDRNNALGLKM